MKKVAWYGCAVGALAMGAMAPAFAAEPTAETSRDGLTAQDRSTLYHTAEGSEMLPLTWMLSLYSVSTGKPFFENSERFGLLKDPDDPLGLPVGFATSVPRDLRFMHLEMTGATCGACHVGEVRYGGKSMRLVGGASFFNAHAMQSDLVNSLTDLIKHPKKLFAFIGRAGALGRKLKKHAFDTERADDVADVAVELAQYEKGSGEEALSETISNETVASDDTVRAHIPKLKSAKLKKRNAAQVFSQLKETLKVAVSTLAILVERARLLQLNAVLGNAKVTDAGAGRVDAFGTLMYRFFGKDHLPQAPVSFPHLYNISTTRWYHYDGNTSTITERNIGNAIGLGVIWDPSSKATTLMPRGVHTMESIFWKAKAPKWPETMLGALDATKVNRGREIFNAECAGCHVKRADELISVASIGTDPGRFDIYHFDVKGADGKPENALIHISHLLKTLVQKAREQDKMTDAEIRSSLLGRPEGTWDVEGRKGKIRIPRLTSVWTTAPYLHNGSVPSLDELLQPPSQRPKKFLLGSYNFDPKHVGFVTKESHPAAWQFDTRVRGNSNAGHEYGTRLSSEDRAALIEYLKTL